MGDLFICEFDFEGENIDEISIEINERIQIIRSDDDGWIYGLSLKSGKNGWIPSAFGRIVNSGEDVKQDSSIPFEGILMKRNITGIFTSWKSRNFHYDGNCLNYYATPGGVQKGSVILNSLSTAITPEKAGGKTYAFEVSCYKKISGGGHDSIPRTLVLAAATEQDRRNWITSLNTRLPMKRPHRPSRSILTTQQQQQQQHLLLSESSPEPLKNECLEFGGSYRGDVKDTADFKYVVFDEMPRLTSAHKSLMAKTLTSELFAKLRDVVTSKQYTLSNAIMTGVVTPHLGVGCTAGDEESWEVFRELYYPIIKGWHGYDAYTQKHPMDLDASKLQFSAEQRALFAKYVASTRIRAARNISGYALPAGATERDRAEVERVLEETFRGLSGELFGAYYKLGELTDAQRDSLLERGFLFQIPSTRNLLTGAGAARSWPDNRGIFHNEAQTALAWVNEEDHCRIISMEDGGDIPSVFARFCELSNAVKASAEANGTRLMWNDTLGFLGTCPSNLGTGLRASVMVRLPCFNKLLEGGDEGDRELLETVCSAYDLQPRGSAGEHSAAVGAKFDISNKQRLGLSEVQLVQKMIDGVSRVIELEEMLAGGGSAFDVRSAISGGGMGLRRAGVSGNCCNNTDGHNSSPPCLEGSLSTITATSGGEGFNPFDDAEDENDDAASSGVLGMTSSNNPFHDCEDDEEYVAKGAAASKKANLKNIGEGQKQLQSSGTSPLVYSRRDRRDLVKPTALAGLPSDLRELLLMGFKPAVALEAHRQCAGAQVMTALDTLRKRLRTESTESASLWANPINLKIKSWTPSEMDLEGAIYTSYIISVSLRWGHYSEWKVMHRNKDFQQLRADICENMSPEQQRKWLPPLPSPGLFAAALHLGGFELDAERNKRMTTLELWLKEVLATAPIVVIPSVRALLLAFLEAEPQMLAIHDSILLGGF